MSGKTREKRDRGTEGKHEKSRRAIGSEPVAEISQPHIPPGEYQAICFRTRYAISYGGRESLYIEFRIYGGKFDGIELFMVCSRPKTKFRPRHKLWDQWCLALDRQPKPGERFCKDIFKGRLFTVLVRDTDRKFSNGKKKPCYMQYSVVDTILSTDTGVDLS